MSKEHPGFAAVAKSIQRKEGVSKKAAGAILASSSRKAGFLAHKLNKNLARVRGK